MLHIVTNLKILENPVDLLSPSGLPFRIAVFEKYPEDFSKNVSFQFFLLNLCTTNRKLTTKTANIAYK